MGQPRFHTPQTTSQTERHAILSKGNYSCKWAKGSVHSRSHNNLIKGSKRESVEEGVGGGQWGARGTGAGVEVGRVILKGAEALQLWQLD